MKYVNLKNKYVKAIFKGVVVGLLLVSAYSVTERYINNRVAAEVVSYFNDHKDELKGDKGNEGITGEQGPQGSVGVTGRAGVTGAKGIVGDKGVAGAKGITGETGSQGTTGAKGQDGYDGCTWLPISQYWYCP